MAAIPPYWAPSFSVWKNRLEDPDTDEGRAFLRERPPLTHIDRAFRPILIVRGLEDVRVTRAKIGADGGGAATAQRAGDARRLP
jgi:hypothetical protein